MKPKLVAIVGPTASGKTAAAIDCALALNGEVICADSRTIYRGLNIGTAKPTVAEMAGVPHFGLDLVEPDQTFSAADFQWLARGWIEQIERRGHLPIIVGGSGLYVDGLLYDFEFGPPVDDEQRSKLEQMTIEQLQQEIITNDIEMPENNKNKRYLIRAIEQGGINRQRQPLPAGVLLIGIDPGQDVLDERIRARAAQIRLAGVVDEAAVAFERYGYDAPGLQTPFYKALRAHYEHNLDLDDCFEQAILNDRRLAKRQRAWFKRHPEVTWVENAEAAKRCVLSNF